MNAYQTMSPAQLAALPTCQLIPLRRDPRGLEVVADGGRRCVTVLPHGISPTADREGYITIERETFRIDRAVTWAVAS